MSTQLNLPPVLYKYRDFHNQYNKNTLLNLTLKIVFTNEF
jgi:hypothetical protein